MADAKISALPVATTPLAGTEVLPVVQSSTTKKVSVENILLSAQPNGIANAVAFLNASKQLTYGSTLTFDGTNFGVGAATLTAKANLVAANGYVLRVGSNETLNTFKYSVIKNIAYNNNSAGVQIVGAKSDSTYSEVCLGGGVDGGYAATSLKFYTAANTTTPDGTERIDVDSSGNVSIKTGNLVIGTAGKGIDFSADPSAAGMTSELLDDYEEGTWTANLYTGLDGGGSLITSVTGYYTKIGNVVTASFNRDGNGSGVTKSISLPFTCSRASSFTTPDNGFGYISPSGTYANLASGGEGIYVRGQFVYLV